MHLKQLRKKVLGEEMDISLTWRTAGGADASVLFVNIIISDNYICMYKDPDLPSTLKLIDTGCTLTCRTASSCSPRLQQGLQHVKIYLPWPWSRIVESVDGIDLYGQAYVSINRPPPHIIVALLLMHLKQLRKNVLGYGHQTCLENRQRRWRQRGARELSYAQISFRLRIKLGQTSR
jgi:hypothetical protein